jgi:hypothetical protein
MSFANVPVDCPCCEDGDQIIEVTSYTPERPAGLDGPAEPAEVEWQFACGKCGYLREEMSGAEERLFEETAVVAAVEHAEDAKWAAADYARDARKDEMPRRRLG